MFITDSTYLDVRAVDVPQRTQSLGHIRRHGGYPVSLQVPGGVLVQSHVLVEVSLEDVMSQL